MDKVYFKSAKDPLFRSIMYGTVIFLFVLSTIQYLTSKTLNTSDIFGHLTLLLTNGLLISIIEGTNYSIDKQHVYYRSSFLRGKIPINKITKLEVGKTMWVGYRPATSRNGIVVHYGKYRKIYFSPRSNEKFVEILSKINEDLIVE
ncbi:MAG: hypothetical protein CNE98_02815 [Bacteroidetes bacterium MED-G17]|nr:MAG: hypothetical protein CNE98_02815 [Bacteroidetes bacterium MED-G17]